MKPRHYVDFLLAHRRGTGREAVGLPVPVIASMTLKVLHGAFSQRPASFALALPRHDAHLGVLRIFASNRDDLDWLVGAVESHHVVRDHVVIGYPRQVPSGFQGPWKEYRRFRVPTRTADRKAGAPLRARRMRQAEEARFPFFQLRSQGTGQSFSLIVEPVDVTQPPDGDPDMHPDGYGLSRRQSPVLLPDLTV